VAIGRAIVRDARLFLFDEPLSNLDAKLRDEMRAEIKRLHQELGKTMIYVTHDQVEAMTLADRIVLMRDGHIEQQGAPLDLFERPATGFVASFLGSPSMNMIPAALTNGADGGNGVALRLQTGETLALPAERASAFRETGERAVTLGLRPQHFARAAGTLAPGHVRLSSIADLIQPTGTQTYVTSTIGGVPVIAEVGAHDVSDQGAMIDYAVDMTRAVLIDPETDRVL
jgi:multiple sugar transport system ATP-binding protein